MTAAWLAKLDYPRAISLSPCDCRQSHATWLSRPSLRFSSRTFLQMLNTEDRPGPGPLGATDPSRWRLDASDHGRHVWHYIREKDSTGYEAVWGEDTAGVRQQDQTEETKYWAGLPLPPVNDTVGEVGGDPYKAARKGFEFYKRIQSKDGHWAGGKLQSRQEPKVGPELTLSGPRQSMEDRCSFYPALSSPCMSPRHLFLKNGRSKSRGAPQLSSSRDRSSLAVPCRYLANIQRKGEEDDCGWGM